ncbi:hypothetical protein ACM66B_002476 [Microbotryomycetes sp. NB124-2]
MAKDAAKLARPIPLRSGFYALPLDNNKTHVAARLHSTGAAAENDEEDDEDDARTKTRLFVTSLPPLTTAKHLKRTFGEMFDADVTGVDVVAGATSAERFGGSSLFGRDAVVSAAKPDVQQLFRHSDDVEHGLEVDHAPSCIVTFARPVDWPPPTYSSGLTLQPSAGNKASTTPASSYLSLSAHRYKTARPHRSTVIAHSDSWMNDFDKRKLSSVASASTSAAVLADSTATLSATQRKKLRKSQAQANAQPAPGSAAAALATFAATQAKLGDKDFNPDEPDEEGWTLVTRGGKHGKSMLPEGAVPSVTGYGATTFRVGKATAGSSKRAAGQTSDDDDDGVSDDDAAKQDLTARERKRLKAEFESGVRKTVGSGFYRFTKQAERRSELANLKRRFEEDKSKLGKMRRSRGAGDSDRSAHGRRDDSRARRAFKPY